MPRFVRAVTQAPRAAGSKKRLCSENRPCTQARRGFDLFIRQRTIRTLSLRVRPVWPTGRYLVWHVDGSTSVPQPATGLASSLL